MWSKKRKDLEGRLCIYIKHVAWTPYKGLCFQPNPKKTPVSELGPGNQALHLHAESLWTRLGKKEKESKKKNCSRVLKDARRSAVTFRFRSLGSFFFFFSSTTVAYCLFVWPEIHGVFCLSLSSWGLDFYLMLTFISKWTGPLCTC